MEATESKLRVEENVRDLARACAECDEPTAKNELWEQLQRARDRLACLRGVSEHGDLPGEPGHPITCRRRCCAVPRG